MSRSPSRHAPRLFVALRFSGDVEDALADIATDVPGASWSPSVQYHLTLRFIGDPGHLNLDDIDRALRAVQAPAFALNLMGTGHFPLRGAPEVLWVGVEENPSLASLRNRVESALVRAGLPPEGRKFHPHVTLANVKGCAEADVARFRIRNGLFRLDSVEVTEFLLCSSVLREGGAEHTVEEAYGLD